MPPSLLLTAGNLCSLVVCALYSPQNRFFPELSILGRTVQNTTLHQHDEPNAPRHSAALAIWLCWLCWPQDRSWWCRTVRLEIVRSCGEDDVGMCLYSVEATDRLQERYRNAARATCSPQDLHNSSSARQNARMHTRRAAACDRTRV